MPTDFSEPSQAAWTYAQMLARQFRARIHLLHVVPQPYLYDAWGTETVTLRLVDLLARSEDVAHEELARLVPRRGPLAGRVVTATATGITVDQILKYVATQRIDLVVMGTHGRGLVGHLMLGSVADRLVKRSPVPVVTVRDAARRPARKRSHKRRVSGPPD